MANKNDPEIIHLIEDDQNNFWIAREPDGEDTYHLQINNVTLHFFIEEWQETLKFLKKVVTTSTNIEGNS